MNAVTRDLDTAVKALRSVGAQASPDANNAVRVATEGDPAEIAVVVAVMGQFAIEWYLTIQNAHEPLSCHLIAELGQLRVLRSLTLTGVDVEAMSVEGLAPQQGLRELRWRTRSPLGSATDSLATLTGLEVLDLSGSCVSDAGLGRLFPLRKLREIVCTHTEVSSGIESFATLPRLERLSLVRTLVDDRVVAVLGKSQSLARLDLSGCRLTATSLECLAQFPALRQLDLSCNDLSAAINITPGIHGPLRDLSLDHCGLTDNAFAGFLGPKLERLSLTGNPLSPATLFSIRRRLPQCQIILQNVADLQNPDLEPAVEWCNEHDGCADFDDQGFLHASVGHSADEFCERFAGIWGLATLQMEDWTIAGLKALQLCQCLRELKLIGTPSIAQDGNDRSWMGLLPSLASLTSLCIHLTGSAVDGLATVFFCANLRRLEIQGTEWRIDPAFWSAIPALPHLTHLTLLGGALALTRQTFVVMPEIESLTVGSSQLVLDREGVAEPRYLRQLRLEDLSLDAAAWRQLLGWPVLKTLSLKSLQGQPIPLPALLALAKLSELDIENCSLDFERITETVVSRNLRCLYLRNCGVTEPEENRLLTLLSTTACDVHISSQVLVTKSTRQVDGRCVRELIEFPESPLYPRILGTTSCLDSSDVFGDTTRAIIRTGGGRRYREADPN
jgi:Leucine-rich repeat (LRR) protein